MADPLWVSRLAIGALDGSMQVATIHIETLQDPNLYSEDQIKQATLLSAILARGRFVLAEPPDG